jgi:hypothetical protein
LKLYRHRYGLAVRPSGRRLFSGSGVPVRPAHQPFELRRNLSAGVLAATMPTLMRLRFGLSNIFLLLFIYTNRGEHASSLLHDSKLHGR